MEIKGYVGGDGHEFLILAGQKRMLDFVKNTNTDTTIRGMEEWVRRFYGDLAEYADWSLEDFYDMVKNLPYEMEKKEWGKQIVMRPKDIFSRLLPIVACANKAVLISSFLTMRGIQNGFVVSANSPSENFGHVFNWVKFPNSGTIAFVDATYPENVIFREKKYAKRKVYPMIGTALVLLSGDNSDLLGRSFASRMKTRVRRNAGRIALAAATGGESEVARAAYKISQGQKLAGQYVLGRSFLKRMSSKARNMTHAALNVATAIPGVSGIAQSVRSAGNMVDTVSQGAGKAISSSDVGNFIKRQIPKTESKMEGVASSVPGVYKTSKGYLYLGGGAVALALVTVLILRKKK